MAICVVDTHALLWNLFQPSRLSPIARQVFADADRQREVLFVASISMVEVVYLVERGRFPLRAVSDLERLFTAGTRLALVPLDLRIVQAMRFIPAAMVPEMPDRLIAATALHLSLPLLTRDHRLQASPIATIW